MNHPFPISAPRFLPAAVLLAITLTGCGQKGPLYLASPPPARVKTAPAQNMSTPEMQANPASPATPTDAAGHGADAASGNSE